jgi:hypothetical protein
MKPKMRTPDATWLALNPRDKFNPFYQKLQNFLKSRLTLNKVAGAYWYYSCGHDYHHWSDGGWKPFENLEEFCELKGFDPYEVRDLIEDRMGKKLVCECQIANDRKVIGSA